MKLLTLLRHAKSDWGDPGLADFDRGGYRFQPEMSTPDRPVFLRGA